MKKMFSLVVAVMLVLSVAGVALAAETGSAPAKPAGEEVKSEAVASPAKESVKEAVKEAEPAKGEEAKKEMAPAVPAEKK
jgi:Spy/CpxP family protein refolding chaperone